MTQAEIIMEDSALERWLETRTAEGALGTVIGDLSPSNKGGDGVAACRRKQIDLLSAEISLVEIDFIREGQHVLAVRSGLGSR